MFRGDILHLALRGSLKSGAKEVIISTRLKENQISAPKSSQTISK